MSEYKKLDLSKLKFQPSDLSYEEILEGVTPPDKSLLSALCRKESKIKVEKDYEKKCVKLEILS